MHGETYAGALKLLSIPAQPSQSLTRKRAADALELCPHAGLLYSILHLSYACCCCSVSYHSIRLHVASYTSVIGSSGVWHSLVFVPRKPRRRYMQVPEPCSGLFVTLLWPRTGKETTTGPAKGSRIMGPVIQKALRLTLRLPRDNRRIDHRHMSSHLDFLGQQARRYSSPSVFMVARESEAPNLPAPSDSSTSHGLATSALGVSWSIPAAARPDEGAIRLAICEGCKADDHNITPFGLDFPIIPWY